MKAIFFCLLLTGAVTAAPALAHSVGWHIDTDAPVVVLRFSYAGDVPIAFAEVTVTAPDGQVYQKGRADRLGQFAVALPDADGAVADTAWQALAEDGQGHSVTASFTPDASDAVSDIRDGIAKGVAGLALVLLICCIVLVMRLQDMRRAGRT